MLALSDHGRVPVRGGSADWPQATNETAASSSVVQALIRFRGTVVADKTGSLSSAKVSVNRRLQASQTYS